MVIAIEIILSRSKGPQRPWIGRLFGNHSAGVVCLDDLVASNYCLLCRSICDNLVYYRDYLLLIHINNSKIMICIFLCSLVNDDVGWGNILICERDTKRTCRDLKFGRTRLNVGRWVTHIIRSNYSGECFTGRNLIIYCVASWLTSLSKSA